MLEELLVHSYQQEEVLEEEVRVVLTALEVLVTSHRPLQEVEEEVVITEQLVMRELPQQVEPDIVAQPEPRVGRAVLDQVVVQDLQELQQVDRLVQAEAVLR
jgi:hypothetical protein